MSHRAKLLAAFTAALAKDAEEALGVDLNALRALPKAERIAALGALLRP